MPNDNPKQHGIGSAKLPLVELSSVITKVSEGITVEPDQLYREIGVRSHGKGIFHKEPVTGKSLGEKRVFHVQPNCLVLNIVFAWEQAVAVTSEREEGMIASHRFPMYQPIENEADLTYLLYFFKSTRGKHLLGLASPGGAGRNRTLGQGDFMDTCIPLPPIAEQRKIAAILTVWDRAIDQTENLIAAKHKRKVALVQQLLTGKVRLPEFGSPASAGTLPSGWQRLTFLEFARRVVGSVQWADGMGDMPCIELEHISQRTGSLLGSTMLSLQASMKNKVGVGQVLFGKLRPNLRKYLHAPFDGACSTEIWVLDSLPGKCLNHFLFYLVQANDFHFASLTTSGSKMPRADWEIVSETDFSLPPLNEQKAIAARLHTQDQEIERLQKRLDALQRQKKGLTQQLLTGKVRVNVTRASGE